MTTTATTAHEGKIKFFNSAKGYGFIKNVNGQEHFFHHTGLNDEVKQDDNVSFELAAGKKGENAVKITLI